MTHHYVTEHDLYGCTGAWEYYGHSRKCSDCGRGMLPTEAAAEAPQPVVTMDTSRIMVLEEPAAPRVHAEARPDWDSYYLAGAQWAASRADCTRAQVGALVVSREHRIGVGYNGLIAGVPGCASAGNCPRGRHFRRLVGSDVWYDSKNDQHHSEDMYGCACGSTWPCPEASAPDSDYANCPATHAERNAIQHSRPEDLPGATLYVTRAPCPACRTLAVAVGIARVVTPEGSYEV